LVLPFHVSLPGSPGAETVYLRHTSLPVCVESRNPVTHTDIAQRRTNDDAVLDDERRRRDPKLRLAIRHVGFPRHLASTLSVATIRAGQLAGEMTRLPHSAAPRLISGLSCFGSIRHTMRPTSPALPSIL
jgi:hypothetical protein